MLSNARAGKTGGTVINLKLYGMMQREIFYPMLHGMRSRDFQGFCIRAAIPRIGASGGMAVGHGVRRHPWWDGGYPALLCVFDELRARSEALKMD